MLRDTTARHTLERFQRHAVPLRECARQRGNSRHGHNECAAFQDLYAGDGQNAAHDRNLAPIAHRRKRDRAAAGHEKPKRRKIELVGLTVPNTLIMFTSVALCNSSFGAAFASDTKMTR